MGPWDFRVFLQPVPTGDTTYLGWLLQGLRTTVLLSGCAWALALLLGTVLGVFRTVPSRALRALATAYVEIFRNVPLLAQLFLWYFVVPEIVPGGERFKQIDPWLQQFLASAVCLGLFTAARVCEQVRAGIQSLARGQRSAALALGLTLPQAYRHVLLPMAARIIVPPLTSETLNVFKNSAVCSTVGLLELTAQGRQLVDYTAHAYESFFAVTVLYLVLNTIVLAVMRWVESRIRVPGYLGAGR
ncbi:MAG: amino acid ABC transporter permease [Myxococcales bacterium]